MSAASLRSNLFGAFAATGAMVFFSVTDVTIKFLSGDYPLHEIVLFRSFFGMLTIVIFFLPFVGGFSVFRTQRLGMHLFRGMCVVMANLFFFLGLAVLPLAEAVAIFFISPLLIAVLSIIFLGERVGPRRWIAIFAGLIGVTMIVRPGTESFQIASLLPILSAFCYAMLNILTRHIGGTESAVTMTLYIQITFVLVSSLMGLFLGGGQMDSDLHPSLSFLLREWHLPKAWEYWLFLAIGVSSAIAGFLISFAYRHGEATFVAPFEYVAMPISIFWGFMVFGETPDLTGFAGIALIMASGLFMVYRDIQTSQLKIAKRPRFRR
jgi:drug/metabolite transporter (DMT)-like permease